MSDKGQLKSYKKRWSGSFLPAIALFFLAPLTAEYIIGYLNATGNLTLILGELLIMAPL